MLRAGWMVLGLVVAACGDDGTLPPAEGCDPGAFVGQWTSVTFRPDGSVDEPVPRDLSDFTFSALVESETGPTEIVGTSHLGGFRIADVPDTRPIMIRAESAARAPQFLITDGCRWDSTSGTLDRGVPYATDPATQLVLDVAGLEPWNRGHTLTAFMPGIWDVFWLDAPVEDEATTGAGFRDEGSTWPLLTLEDAQATTVFQSRSTTLDGEPRGFDLVEGTPPLVSTIVASGDLAPFALVDGDETAASVTLTPLVADRAISVGIDGDAFAGFLADARAFARFPVELAVRPSPGLGCRPGPKLVHFSTPASGRAVLDAHPYVDPFPTDWDRVACLRFDVLGPPDPLYGFPGSVRGTVEQGAYLEEVENTMIVPAVSFPRSWTIGGQDPWEPAGPIGLTPTIAWQDPVLGGGFSYWLAAYADGLVATFEVETGASFVVPEGLLQPGQEVAFYLYAFGEKGTSSLISARTLTP